METRIYPDGSFDLCSGSIQLLSAYPSVDGVPVRPLRIETGPDHVRYELSGGTLAVSFREENGRLALSCTVEDLSGAHDIAPLAGARIAGCDRVFYQGLGIAGPSGFADLPDASVTSHSLAAVGTEAASLVLYALRQDRFHNFYTVKDGCLSAGFDTEGIPPEGGELPLIYLREGTDYSRTLRACAGEIAAAMHARPVTKPAFHWCSWYYLYHNLDQPTLEEYLDGFTKYRDIAPFTHIQIDAGYFPSCGDWLRTNERFPDGLEKAARTILDAGYEPGIWVAPFMVGDNSLLFREHPDWMLKSRDGGYVTPWKWYNEPKVWGYRDCDYYVLDTSHPDAMAYLKNVFTTLRGWGYTLFKTDFLLWGLQDSTKVIRHTPGKTSFEYFRDVMAVIREAIGEDARWLGCIAPFMPSLGFVDMIRVASDVGAQWEEGSFGPTNMIRELTADQYFNNLYWQNDPDAVMLRDFHIYLTAQQVEALALLAAMSGSTVYTSDPIHAIGEDRRRLLAFIRPDALHTAEFPFFGSRREETCIVQHLKTRTLVYFFNPTDRAVTRLCDWKSLAGEDKRYLLRYHGTSRRTEEVPFVEIPPRAGVLYFASAEPILKEPGNLWEE